MSIWKWLGLAGAVGLGTAGAAAMVRRRRWRNYDSDDLRDQLHDRLRAAEAGETSQQGTD